MRCLRRASAVTLTEVVVGLAVVVLLVAILVPVLTSVRANALETSCASSANQNGLAALIYAQDSDGTYAYQDQSNIQDNRGKGRGGAIVDNWKRSRRSNWAKEIASYTRSREIGNCPAAQGWADGAQSDEEPLSYIYNGWASGRAQSEATTPSTLVMLYDGRYKTSWATANPVADSPRGRKGGKGNGGKESHKVVHGDDGATYADIWNLTDAPPHRVDGDQGQYNVVFLDAHCRSMNSHEFQSHAQYEKNQPPKGLRPPIPQNHFAF